MKLLDPGMMGAALVLVPTLAWWFGRLAGRRNLSAPLTVLAGGSMALLVLLAQSVLLSTIEAGGLAEGLAKRALEAAQGPEFVAFLIVFGVFMTMLSWSATPAVFTADDRNQT